MWRITRRAHTALDGEGARLFGGRWNSEGVPLIYASATLSLAALEYLAHLDVEDVPADLVALEVEVADGAPAEVLDVEALPPDWTRSEGHPACVEAGDRWAREGRTLALHVPSAVIPEERNVLLNPRHPAAARLCVASARDFSFDLRLLR